MAPSREGGVALPKRTPPVRLARLASPAFLMSRSSRLGLVATAGLLALSLPAVASAQSLRGSRASIERMYRHAVAEQFSFFETPASVRRQVAEGRLVRLEPDGNFALHRVGYPYVRPATRTFVQRLSAQFRDACGESLVVTSAVRPATRQPANSADLSVHPTGMAVDLRKPKGRACRKWLRDVLLELEGMNVLEATEEYAPPHFHVAVFPTEYGRYVGTVKDGPRVQLATESADGASTYTVRAGDTLWDIAQMHDTTVDALKRANGLRGAAIRPGQELRIPSGG